jgi:hypothetical protein
VSAAKEEAMKHDLTHIGTRILALFAVSAGFATTAAPASAGPVGLSGVQLGATTLPTAPCTAADPMFAGVPVQENVMTGSLVGCWYTDTFVAHAAQPNGTPSGEIQATGTEHFIGCLDLDTDGSCIGDPSGSLASTYQFSGKFDPVTLAEIHGRCQHPIVPGSGTGVFTGASGVITFNDDVGVDANNNGCSSYRAQITL